jgi:hypothetical protein
MGHLRIPYDGRGQTLCRGECQRHFRDRRFGCQGDIHVLLLCNAKPFTSEYQGIWPHKKPNKLTRIQAKHTSAQQTQFQIGFDPRVHALVSLNLADTVEQNFEAGQTLNPTFSRNGFEVSLGVDRHSSMMNVVDLAEFFVLVQLDEERMCMDLDVDATVTYSSRYRKKVVQGQ